MREITMQVYPFQELDKKARTYALSKYQEHNDYPFLYDELYESLRQFLDEEEITVLDDQSCKIYYSLSSSQGDGVCFIGTFAFIVDDLAYNVTITHKNRYYHYNSVDFIVEPAGDYISDDLINNAEDKFKKLYKEICNDLEKEGYAHIDYENSEEHFQNMCDINEWEFFKTGVLYNGKR